MLLLSDLIRKGAVGREQAFGQLKDKQGNVCALGAAIEGAIEAGLIANPEKD